MNGDRERFLDTTHLHASFQRALKVGQIFLRDTDRFSFVLDQDINHTVGTHDGHRPHLFRAEPPKPAAFDHGRSRHPQIGVSGGNDGVAAAEQGCVAGIATAGHNTERGHDAGEPCHADKGMTVQKRNAVGVGDLYPDRVDVSTIGGGRAELLPHFHGVISRLRIHAAFRHIPKLFRMLAMLWVGHHSATG